MKNFRNVESLVHQQDWMLSRVSGNMLYYTWNHPWLDSLIANWLPSDMSIEQYALLQHCRLNEYDLTVECHDTNNIATIVDVLVQQYSDDVMMLQVHYSIEPPSTRLRVFIRTGAVVWDDGSLWSLTLRKLVE